MKVCFPSSWKAVHNYSTGPVARIFLGWDSSVVEVTTLFSSNQLIVAEVKVLSDKKKFLLSVVYGHNRIGDRRSLWHDMKYVYQLDNSKPWIQLGEMLLGNQLRLVGFDDYAGSEFNDCLLEIARDDFPSKGFWFTWTNKRGGVEAHKSKLDRVLTNISWMDLFRNAKSAFLAPGVLDHCLISVTMVPPNGRPKPFRFFNFWLQNPTFGQILNDSWNVSSQCLSFLLN